MAFKTHHSLHNSLLLLALLLMTPPVCGQFSVGRISEGMFEYQDLGGWMTPRQGQLLCDQDMQCGGFTYKVNNYCMVQITR